MKYDAQNIEDGVYADMSIETYHENKTHLSASSIKESFKSMAHFKAYLDKENKYKSHLDFGNAFELSITDADRFLEEVEIYDENERPEADKTFGSKLNKAWKENFYKDNANKLIIPLSGSDSLDVLTILKDSLFSHSSAPILLKNSNYQTSIFWTDKETGLKLKTRPDFWKPATSKRSAIITDLKTDVDSESSKHIRKICNLNYPIQSVMQIMGLKSAGLINDNVQFYWIVGSKSTPFNTEVYEFDSSDITAFTDALRFKLDEIKRAKEKGVWLSYEPERDMGIKSVEFPYYYKKSMGIVELIES